MFSSTVFIKFLEYILRYNPTVNQEIKHTSYTVMNNINDDFAKNTISGLLDFIFNKYSYIITLAIDKEKENNSEKQELSNKRR